MSVFYEFDSRNSRQIGQFVISEFSFTDDQLTIDANGKKVHYKRIDDGSAPLTGVSHITGRMQDGTMAPIHRTGTRKTIKIISGTRFQWAAIDLGTKNFSEPVAVCMNSRMESILNTFEFFSRDSSRVGASLSFVGKLENGEWHHSGLSSTGEKISETWGRVER